MRGLPRVVGTLAAVGLVFILAFVPVHAPAGSGTSRVRTAFCNPQPCTNTSQNVPYWQTQAAWAQLGSEMILGGIVILALFVAVYKHVGLGIFGVALVVVGGLIYIFL